MRIDLIEAAESDKELVRNLMQLYQYDFSEREGSDVDAHGRFEYRWLDHYWTEEDRRPFLIRADNQLAGFVLVNRYTVISSAGYSIAEFFVMRKYRRKGVGSQVARQIFRMFPGKWEVREDPGNTEAQAFWRKVIGEETGGRYEEVQGVPGAWEGPIQVFEVTG